MKRREDEPYEVFLTRILKSAFRHAEAGRERDARKLWDQAVDVGWKPKPKNLKSFEIAIQKGSTKDDR